MNRISKKDFIQYPNRYIVEGSFILTLYGKDEYEIIIKKVTNKVTIIDKVTNNSPDKVTNTPQKVTNNQKVTTSPNVQQKIDKVLTTVPGMKTVEDKRPDNIASGNRYAKKFTPNWQRDTSKHGCGCKKEEGKALCSKHERA